MDIVITGDGSHTLIVPDLQEHYHSKFGAVNESKHVFIEAGLKKFDNKDKVTIFEAGLGTGLNALLTCIHVMNLNMTVEYNAIEKYPLKHGIALQLNYPQMVCPQSEDLYRHLHLSPWGERIRLAPGFELLKICGDLTEYEHKTTYDLIYFDAFGPEKQPEMWTENVFSRIYDAMNPGGILVTYSVRGAVKRALKNAGFKLEKLPGPFGKREMLRAFKE